MVDAGNFTKAMQDRLWRDLEESLLGSATSTAPAPAEGFTLAKFDEAVRKISAAMPPVSARDEPLFPSPLMRPPPGTIDGFALIGSAFVGKQVEDWSDVRSPARARRRRRLGHPQRIRVYTVPDGRMYRFGDTIIGHPLDIVKIESVRS